MVKILMFYVEDSLLTVNVFAKFMSNLILIRAYVTKAYYVHKTATNGAGPATNPSKPLSSQIDLQGNPVAQNAVYPDPVLGTVYFPQSALAKEIQGSNAFYQRSEVIANDKANSRTGMSICKENLP